MALPSHSYPPNYALNSFTSLPFKPTTPIQASQRHKSTALQPVFPDSNPESNVRHTAAHTTARETSKSPHLIMPSPAQTLRWCPLQLESRAGSFRDLQGLALTSTGPPSPSRCRCATWVSHSSANAPSSVLIPLPRLAFPQGPPIPTPTQSLAVHLTGHSPKEAIYFGYLLCVTNHPQT